MKTLERNLVYCYIYDCFGFDNRIKIKIMLEVMRMDRSKEWIDSAYGDADRLIEKESDDTMWQAALDARSWLDGEFELEELLFSEREGSERTERLADIEVEKPGWLVAAITAAAHQ
ncbi:hypothetical protein [Mucilaginibacter aquariorum]|uniref:Uncharacterized protein n=1 Tax=Mucilaginibacter aquariorum TaxID=2967225 RepID=A0ABT1SVP4_9SPHI|nr:hypothetical protein [Mucilaginibacter aquariorum]MCQ6956332.1 hypothetical protein [Mucilaginibacter aquariorum]